MTTFRDLAIGDTFDFIGPDPMLNSFYERCRKIGARTYETVPDHMQCRVGSVAATVYHIEQAPEWSGTPDPNDPDNFWIDDETGERVNAHTGERS